MARLKPLNVRRRPRLDDDDDYVPPLGTAMARRHARREYLRQVRELRAEDEDRPSPSYIDPMD